MSLGSKLGICYQTERTRPEMTPSSASPFHPSSPAIIISHGTAVFPIVVFYDILLLNSRRKQN